MAGTNFILLSPTMIEDFTVHVNLSKVVFIKSSKFHLRLKGSYAMKIADNFVNIAINLYRFLHGLQEKNSLLESVL